MEDVFGENVHKGQIKDRELIPLSFFLGFLENVDVLGDARSVTIIGENFGGEVDDIYRMKPSAM